jgi:hypothetical protein
MIEIAYAANVVVRRPKSEYTGATVAKGPGTPAFWFLLDAFISSWKNRRLR